MHVMVQQLCFQLETHREDHPQNYRDLLYLVPRHKMCQRAVGGSLGLFAQP